MYSSVYVRDRSLKRQEPRSDPDFCSVIVRRGRIRPLRRRVLL